MFIWDFGFGILDLIPHSAFRTPLVSLSLSLLVLRIFTDDAHDAFAVNNLAFITHFLY